MKLTLAAARSLGRDPLAIFRLDEALALDPAWLARVAQGTPLAFWDDEDETAEDSDCLPYVLARGVAVYDIDGPLSQRGWYCFQGYDSIARDLETMLDDPRVRSVVLRINSPGGVVAGLFEGTRRMRAMVEASGKRVTAYADESAYSAAYALACVADEIVLPETGGVGSVGVIGSLYSEAAALAAAGIDVRVLTSGREKADGHPETPISDEAVARTQARVSELAAIFHREVAARRGLTPEAVKALEAGVRYGAAAVASGLADRVGSFEDVLAGLRPALTTPKDPTMKTRTRVIRAASEPTPDPDAPGAPDAPKAPKPSEPGAPSGEGGAPCQCAGKPCPGCDATGECRTCGGICGQCQGSAVTPGEAPMEGRHQELLSALYGTRDGDALVASVQADHTAAALVERLSGELASARAELTLARAASAHQAEASERAALLTTARKDGRITPAMDADPEWSAMVSAFTLPQVKTFVARLPRQVATAPLVPARQGSDDPAGLTPEEQEWADRLGVSPDAILKQKQADAKRARVRGQPQDDDR